MNLRTAVDLLPTPAASLNGYEADVDAFEERRAAAAARHGNNGIGVPLGVAVRMLPTPRASRGASATETVYALGGERQDDERTQGQVVLDDVTDWGKYREAVERAEFVSGIPAPAPAIPDGKGGKMRLHDRFVEWMMMLLPGWVTGHGLTRPKALERLGNGVVPLQAAAATATNLTRLAEYKRAVEALGVAA
jgi:DNA (cytosine-5)-methyltransferase 1